MIRLSFIVPCFMVENYVEHCLNSILKCVLPQEDYEIICVNDGSSDKTLSILRRMEMAHTQMRIIDLRENKGIGEARNIALNQAKGQYIWFVDSDDTVATINIEALLHQAETFDLDVLAFNFDCLDERHQILSDSRTFDNSNVVDGISFAKTVMRKTLFQNIGYVWRFLYRLGYLKDAGLIFPRGICWEDTVFTPKSIIEAKRIKSTSLLGYHYYFHQSSICRVMEKQYPGKLVFDYVFHAGAGLKHYAESIKDAELSTNLVTFTKETYFGKKIVLYLLRTTPEGRKSFYREVKIQKELVRQLIKDFSGLGRCFLIPLLGPTLAGFFSFIYKTKKKLYG